MADHGHQRASYECQYPLRRPLSIGALVVPEHQERDHAGREHGVDEEK
jgi:hypothetical protein